MKNSLFMACALACAASATSTAHAFTLNECTVGVSNNPGIATVPTSQVKWKAAPTFRIHTGDFSDDKVTAIKWAVAEWKSSPAAISPTTAMSTAAPAHGNGVNDIFVSTESGVAATNVIQSCSRGIIETDISFNSSPLFMPWTTSTAKANIYAYGGLNSDMHEAALHEVGHALGLRHTTLRYSLMGDELHFYHTNGAQASSYIGADDIAGLFALYGNDGSTDELSVSHWRWKSKSAVYTDKAENKFADIIDTVGAAVLPSDALFGDVKIYTVKRGASVRPGFTFENTGAHDGGVMTYRYYLSNDDTIGNGDTHILDVRAASPTLAQYYTYYEPVTIPASTPPGNYWLGVIIDVNHEITEYHDDTTASIPTAYSGNAAYIPIKVTK